VEVAIKKVGQREGQERFVLVHTQTREIVTVSDVTEAALRRFFRQRGVPDGEFNHCLQRARQRYAEKSPPRNPVDENAETQGDDLLFQLGLEEDESVHK
jgi:hypothetical protein